MIDFLEKLDQKLVLLINGWHTESLDQLMWWASARITWIPLYGLLLYLSFKILCKKQWGVFVISCVGAIIISDLVSVHLFKNVFMRYRPSHNLNLKDVLHYYKKDSGELYTGGQYGFVSSHASNFFAIITFSCFILNDAYPRLKWFLMTGGLVVCFSRVYLGVHYVSDVCVGAFIGSLISFIIYKFVYHSIVKTIR
jgi:undecaprenyl-diphosphatase